MKIVLHLSLCLLSQQKKKSQMYGITIYEPRCEKKQSSGFPTRSDTNQAIQSQKMARGLKLCIYEVEGLYYPCSEKTKALISFAVTGKLICVFCFRR